MINEGLKSARQFAIKSQIPENIFNKFNGIDFTPTKKYLHQMLKWYVANPELEVMDAQFIKGKIQKYNNALGKSITKQIEEFQTFDDFESFIDKYSSKNALRADSKKDVVFENDKILIIRPADKATVCRYGKNTQWCITMTDDETGDDDHYNRYRFDGGFTFYYCIIKDTNVLTQYATAGNESIYAKVCVLISTDGVIDSIYDSTDETMDFEAFDNLMELCDIDGSQYEHLFLPVPVTKQEKWKRILDNTEYTIENDQYIIKGDLDFTIMENEEFTKMPISIKSVDGNIYAGGLRLNTMDNFPETCTGTVTVVDNNITHFPDHLKEYNTLDMSENGLISTKYIPKITDALFLMLNPTLKKLESMDGMEINLINVEQTGITSLEGLPDALNVFCTFTRIESLNGLKLSPNKVYQTLDFSYNNNLKDIEALKDIPDTTRIIKIKIRQCPHITEEYIRRVLNGKQVDNIIC